MRRFLFAAVLALAFAADARSGAYRGNVYAIVCIGDSITWGTNVANSWPAKIGQSFSDSVHVTYNAGTPGQLTAAMQAKWTNSLSPGSDWSAVVVLGGINDIDSGNTGASAFANLKVIYDDVRSRGLALVVITALPFKNYALYTGAKQTQLDALNTSIRAYGNGSILVDGYALLGDTDPTALKAAYDSGDGIHPNQTGANLIASSVKTALGF